MSSVIRELATSVWGDIAGENESFEHAADSAEELMAIIPGHWDAVENGSPHRRDVTLGEDASRIANATGVPVATVRL